MPKMLAIAVREYLAVVRTKAFLITLVLMPLLMGGSLIFQTILKGQGSKEDKHFAVIDRSPGEKIFQALAAAARQRNETQITDPQTGKRTESAFVLERMAPEDDPMRQRYELSERVRHKELDGFVEIGEDVYDSPAPGNALVSADLVRFQSNSPLARTFPGWAQRVVSAAVEEGRIARAGLPRATVMAATQPVPLVARDLTQRNRETGALEDGKEVNFIASFLVPIGLVMLMFMMIMIGATPLMQGVVEEKTQRIAEMLLGSVKPFPLMLGKLLGTVGISLTLAGVYLGGAYWASRQFGYAQYLAPDVIAWFVVYMVLAVFLYGSLFIAIGAAAAEIKETQTLMMPVMVMACIPMFSMVHVIEEPDSTVSLALSFFPPATPMLMVARQSVPPGLPWWQPAVGVATVLAATLLCVYAAGRIFRIGILMQGKGAKFGEMLKWVMRG